MDIEPPFQKSYKTLFFKNSNIKPNVDNNLFKFEDCLLPEINLDHLNFGQLERENCVKEIVEAASQLGFFQVVNHGIPHEVLERMLYEEKKLFHQPFSKKAQENYLNLPANSYRWGNPKATCPIQFLWSEAFHISLKDTSTMDETNTLRSTIEVYATKVESLARRLCEVLAKNLSSVKSTYFDENCPTSSSYLRLNRYPPCPFSSQVFGLVPHTDTDFLTVVFQDQVGGLQLKMGGQWFSVKPSPKALVINIGDLFQALSNGVYKSLEHRVVAPREVERFSTAYFFCPSYDAVIQNCSKPALYRKFSFIEYKLQTQQDIEVTGDKVGLSKFLL